MHTLFDGATRHELAHLIFLLGKAGISVARINAAIRSYRRFPPDVRIPPLSNNLSKGTKAGRPVKKRHVSASAFQIMHLALHRQVESSIWASPIMYLCTYHTYVHTYVPMYLSLPMYLSCVPCLPMRSIAIIEPLLSAEQRLLPEWVCWCKHVELVTMAVQHSISRADLDKIDKLVEEHGKLFDEVRAHASAAAAAATAYDMASVSMGLTTSHTQLVTRMITRLVTIMITRLVTVL